MSKKKKRILWPLLIVLLTSIGALAFMIKRPRNLSERSRSKPIAAPAKGRGVAAPAAKANGATSRNLSLQPEAFNLSRRLGQRFGSNKREQSTLVGALTIGTDQKTVTMIRKQTDDGEQVEIHLAGAPGLFTWDAAQGALSSNARATGRDRDLIERLVFDSPDQFVLAQLRGSSYYTIARNVRPAGAADGYSGPLWNIVRVDDPERDAEKRPVSSWRLYYVNVNTGLVDRIVSDFQGQRLTAELSGWIDVSGEKVPAQITWTNESQTLMQYSLNNFSHAQN